MTTPEPVPSQKPTDEREEFVCEYKGFRIVLVRQKGWSPWYRGYRPDGRLAYEYFKTLEKIKKRIDQRTARSTK